MTRSCAVGIRVKSGWASAVLVGLDSGVPQYLHRGRLLLADPSVPKSAQPYHRGLGRLQKDSGTIARLTAVVRKAAAHSLAAFLKECRRGGHAPHIVALVVGSTIDPAKVSNEHIRAHAYEGRLFRTALEHAAGRLGLRFDVMRQRDLPQLARSLGPGAQAAVGALGTAAGRPWRADEKLATLAAWVAYTEGRRTHRHDQHSPER